LNDSLSIILPVHNAQDTLATQVADVLDVMAELTSTFELLIMDDGSTDATEEIAHDLARTYPQVQFSRHRKPQGTNMALENGLNRTSGDVVLLCDTPEPVSASELRHMWSMRHDEAHDNPNVGQPDMDLNATWLSQLLTQNPAENPDGQRKSIRTIRSSQSRARRAVATIPSKGTGQINSRTDYDTADQPKRPKPNFLMKIRNFALDE